MLWKNSDIFSYENCAFEVQKVKASTARVVYYKELGIINSFTIEVWILIVVHCCLFFISDLFTDRAHPVFISICQLVARLLLLVLTLGVTKACTSINICLRQLGIIFAIPYLTSATQTNHKYNKHTMKLRCVAITLLIISRIFSQIHI